ncbi:hypothetical protein K0M31_004509 [Melipona bicolor]|uniref:Uncharacterized protein n=1 Tax=Melipona bicolor TaxID=60889 RepID=A0AA40KNF0_9HYME|nr:hypothetical protein K0M31_004509 [Melipona bicolor]
MEGRERKETNVSLPQYQEYPPLELDNDRGKNHEGNSSSSNDSILTGANSRVPSIPASSTETTPRRPVSVELCCYLFPENPEGKNPDGNRKTILKSNFLQRTGERFSPFLPPLLVEARGISRSLGRKRSFASWGSSVKVGVINVVRARNLRLESTMES